MRTGESTSYTYTFDIKAHVGSIHLLLSTQKFVNKPLNFRATLKLLKVILKFVNATSMIILFSFL